MKHGSLFSGIGGFDLAAEWCGWENIFHCEWNPFGRKVLSHYWPKSISYEDITKTDFTIHRGKIDILTGGFPCQPYSTAGKRLGKEDDRHLWPEMLRAIREIQPRWVVGENVRGLVNWSGGLVFEEVQADLENEGYEVQSFILPACAVNAPHRRDRVWIVAYSESGGQRGLRNESKKTGARESDQSLGGLGGISFATHTCNEQLQGSFLKGGFGREGQTETKSGQFSRSVFGQWEEFPTQSPICDGNDGISADTYRETVSKEYRMDRDIVIKKALDQGRLLADHNTGKIYSTTLRGRKGEKVELPGADCNGYRVHNIYIDGVKKQCRAHQIVWISANGLYDNKNLMIDHINRNRADNRLSNLRLVDAKGNAENADRWEGNFSQNQKDIMHELHTLGNMSFRELAGHFGCSKSRVHQIVSKHNGLYGITFPKWRNESIKAGGNAIVPQVAYQIFKSIIETEKKMNP